MFKKTNKKSENNPNENDKESNNSNSILKSWLTGKLGSFLLLSATGYALYKFGIINKIFSYFKKDKGKGRSEEASSSDTTDKSL